MKDLYALSGAAAGRSRKGAWIEIQREFAAALGLSVAPVRERGLKSAKRLSGRHCTCRSRKGAWIEICPQRSKVDINVSLWVAPVRERGLKYGKEAGHPVGRWSLP